MHKKTFNRSKGFAGREDALKRYLTAFVSVSALAVASPVFAQDNNADADAVEEVDVIEETGADAAPSRAELEAQDTVVVTGSRIRRDAFSSISPVQVITGDTAREIGFIDTASILQSSVQASGVQIDNSFNGFVLDNGPLANNVGLRGLGASRTLTLINSRRVGAGGVGGAPTATDLSILPSVMIDRIEQLLDGASSVYGSDAVAGVVNIILKDDFDGLEIQGRYNHTMADGGESGNIAVGWGKVTDRASFGAAFEFSSRKEVTYGDRDFLQGCSNILQEGEDGVVRTLDTSLVPGTTIDNCELDTTNRVFVPIGFGNVWYTPGETNIDIPNFSETTVNPGFAVFNPTIRPTDVNNDGIPDFGIIDPDGDGLTSVDLKSKFFNFNGSGRERDGHLLTPQELFSAYTYGNYNLDGLDNMELFAEGYFSHRTGNQFGPGAQIFPDVPATNPTNICNPAGFGVNCAGFFGFNFGPQETTPIVMIRGDRDFVEVETNQYRGVVGARGDLSFLDNFGQMSGWGYEGYVSFNRVVGKSSQQGILEDNLLLSLGTTIIDPNNPGSLICGNDTNNDGIPDPSPADDILGRGGCVPVNMFASSIYQEGGGDFATQAERDYLFGERSFKTTTDQLVISGILQGDVMELWNGTKVPLVLGFEYREDEVESVPNDVAANGELFGFFSDGGAFGSRNLWEFFAETSATLLADQPFAKELTFEGAARWTEESTYGAKWTYSLRGRYQPTDFLTFRGTYGTSFRAPNAQEQFLVGVSGFTNISDPCVVPAGARIPSLNPNDPDTYDPTQDNRSPQTLDACRSIGVDPLVLGLDGGSATGIYNIEVFRRGGDFVSSTIDPETSTSWTAGLVFDQTFTDAFTFRLSGTYYSIEIEDSISLLSANGLVNTCLGADSTQQERDRFCPLQTRGADGLVEFVDSSFFNVSSETSKGVDINMLVSKEFVVGERILDASLDVIANRNLENNFIFDDESDVQENLGRIATPKWNGTADLTLELDNKYRLNWFTRFIQGGTEIEQDFADLETCEFLPIGCRDVFQTGSYFVHNVSIAWEPREDLLFVAGVNNVFDRAPEFVGNGATGTQLNNVTLGAGYDLLGRTVALTFRKRF